MLRYARLVLLTSVAAVAAFGQCSVSYTNPNQASDTTQYTWTANGGSAAVSYTNDPTNCGTPTISIDSGGAGWLTATVDATNAVINYVAAPNTGGPRTGNILVTFPNSTGISVLPTYTVNELGVIPSNPWSVDYRVSWVYNSAGCQPQSNSPTACAPPGTSIYVFNVAPGNYTLTDVNYNAPNQSGNPFGFLVYAAAITPGQTTQGTPLPTEVDGSTVVTVAPGQQLELWALNGGTPSSNYSTAGYDVNDFMDVQITPPPQINCTSMTGPTQVGQSWTTTCSGNGGSPPWTVSLNPQTNLPAGFTATSNSDGSLTITGTSTLASVGYYAFSVSGFDDNEVSDVASAAFSGLILPPVTALEVACSPGIGPVTRGIPFTAVCTATGGATDIVWSTTAVQAGAVAIVPTGLTLTGNGSQATLSGTVDASFTGSYTFRVQASSASTQQTASFVFTGNVDGQSAPGVTLGCAPETGPIEVGLPYVSYCLTVASGDSGAVIGQQDASTLPPGISQIPQNVGFGAVSSGDSGIATQTGAYNYTITANSGYQVSETFSGQVVGQPTLSCSNNSGPGPAGQAYTNQCTASGGFSPPPGASPYLYYISAGALPAGLTLDPLVGQVAGVPSQTGPYSYTISAMDYWGNLAGQTITYSGNITQVLSLMCPSVIPAAEVGIPYTLQCTAAGGVTPYTFNTGSLNKAQLPAGLQATQNGATITISGTPTKSLSSYSYAIVVNDAQSSSVTQTISGSVAAALTASCVDHSNPPAPNLMPTTVGQNYQIVCTAANGVTPYSWTANGSIPGISYTVGPANTFTLSGVPTKAGTYSYAFSVQDALAAAQNFMWDSVVISAATPTLTNLSPQTVPAGSPAFTLTLTGTNFDNTAVVLFNGTQLTPSSITSTQLQVTVPASLVALSGPASISVSTAGGSTASLQLAVPPVLSSISPNSVTAGAPAFTLTANGVGYTNLSAIYINGAQQTTNHVGSTQLTAQVPASLVSSPGTLNIEVETSGEGSTVIPLVVGNPPVLTSISPTIVNAGVQNLVLTVNGSNFVTGTLVNVGSTTLTPSSTTNTQLQVSVPASVVATAGALNVTAVTNSVSSAPAVLTVQPTIVSLSPSSAIAGSPAFTLTVNGTGYNTAVGAGNVIEFGGTSYATSTVNAGQLTASIPSAAVANAGNINVRVNSNSIWSPYAAFVVTAAAGLSALNPSSIIAGSPAFTLTVTGTNFTNASTVQWNGSGLATTFVNATTLQASVPANLVASAGNASVTVFTSGVTTPSLPFTINAAPALTLLNPSSVIAGNPAFTLTVSGTNFTAASTVQWNGSALATTFVNPTSVQASVPANLVANAGNATVTVLTSGVTSAGLPFTINAAPALTLLNPSSVIAGSPAFTLTVTGTNFTSGSTVQWNGSTLPTTFVNATSVQAAVPANLVANAGNAAVTVLTSGVSTASLPFTINAAPALTLLNPSSVIAGSPAFTLTVTGTNFTGASTVQWNGSSLVTSFVNATSVEAAVPANLVANSGNATVTVLTSGVTSAGLPFTISAAPALTLLNPSSVIAGSPAFTLTVTGTNFTGASTVQWNGTALATTFVNATSVQASVLANLVANPGNPTVTVLTSGVTSAGLPFTINAAPAPSALSPGSAIAGQSAFTLTVTGTNFLSGSVIQWNGTALATTFVNATTLQAAVPANLIANPGNASVGVLTSGVNSATLPFTINAAPAITSLNPAAATAGQAAFTLTVTGTGFTSAAIVNWNNAPLVTTFVNNTTLQATVGAALVANAGTSQVSVTLAGVSSAATPFVISQTPAITQLTPSSTIAGSAGFAVTVTGSAFVQSSIVQWNGAALQTTFVNATSLSASVPATLVANAGSANITVLTNGVPSNALAFTINAAPVITSLSPAAATAGSGGFTLTVTGSGFPSGAIVYWNGSALVTTYLNATTLQAAIPASLVGQPGNASVDVRLLKTISNAVTFTISSAPVIQQLSPASATAGSGDLALTVAGTAFVQASTVQWNGSALQTTFVNATTLSATVPAALLANAGSANVTVLTNGVTSNTLPFSITAAPVIATLNPAAATAGSAAFTLSVNGTGFTNSAVVNWNGTAQQTTFVNATTLQASIPANLVAQAGTGSVTVTVGTATSNAATFTISAAPVLQQLNPSSVIAGSAPFTLTVTGTAFGQGSVVKWNGSALQTTFVGATSLTASVPANLVASSGTATVTILTNGVTSNALTFTISAAPTIASLNPSGATAGTPAFTLTVNGTGFTSSDVVNWNGAALQTTFVNASTLQAAVPSSLVAQAANSSVTVNTGTVTSNAVTFTVSAAPVLQQLSPSSAIAGSGNFTLTVTGTGFVQGSTVEWNGSALPTTFGNTTSLTAAVPANLVAGSGTASVTIVTNNVTSNPLTFTVSAAPSITSLNPAGVTAGAPAFTLNVTGTGFANGAVVNWNGTALQTTFFSTTLLQAAVPANLVLQPGSDQVTVSTSGVTSAAATFVVAAPPVLQQISPSSAVAGSGAFTLTVSGSGFAQSSTVVWNTTALSSTFINATTLTATVPANLVTAAGSPNITVIAGGVPSNTAAFTIYSAPAVSSLNPSSAIAGGPAFTLTVTGSGFANGAAVNWNGSALQTTFVSGTSLQAAVPATLIATQGTATIAVSLSGVSSNSAAFTVNPSKGVISSLNPSSVAVGASGFTLSVVGSGFTNSSVVEWNGSPLATAFTDAQHLSATIAANLLTAPGTASVTVLTGGTSSAPATFSITAVPAIVGLIQTTLPTQPASVGVQISTAAPADLSGQLQLSFTPSVSGLPAGYMDPALQFSCKGATCSASNTILDFTIPAGQTTVSPLPGGSIQQGTVAGTITVTLTSLKRADTGASVLQAPVTATLTIPALPPVITSGSVLITNVTSSGFTVELNGFSSTRDVSSVTFQFTAANGDKLSGNSTFTIPVTGAFANWFNSSEGQAAGSTFGLSVPFQVSGDSAIVQGVTVTLVNSAGQSTPETGTVQ